MIDVFKQFAHWDLIVVFCLMAALFAFEMVGVFSPHLATITAIIKAYVPMPIRFMVFSWIGWHFIVSDLVRECARTPLK